MYIYVVRGRFQSSRGPGDWPKAIEHARAPAGVLTNNDKRYIKDEDMWGIY